MIFFKDKEKKDRLDNLIGQLKYEYQFVFTLAPTIKAFYPIIENLFINQGGLNITTESIFYLTIASISQLIGKEDISNEIVINKKLDNVLLEKVNKVFKIFKNVVNFFLSKSKKMTKNYIELFAYTSLFVPFASTFSDIISSNSIGLETFINAFTKDFIGKTISTGFGVGVFTIKHFISDILEGLTKLSKKPKDIIDIIQSKLRLQENLLSYDEYLLYI